MSCKPIIRSAEFYFSVPASIRAPFHRTGVAGLLLKAAHSKGVRLTVTEWPGGEPRTAKLRTSPHVVKKVLSGATRLPLAKLSQKDRLKFNALPWCSRVKLFSEESSLAIISGPPKIDWEWFLPILGPDISRETDTLASLQKTASRLCQSRGYSPRS
jgi:hypothetical protein